MRLRSRIVRNVEGVAGREGPSHGRELLTAPKNFASVRSHLAAIVGLLIVFAVALGSMTVFADILGHFYPSHRFDEFAAIHKPVVLGVLVGCSALWTLAPHPIATSMRFARRRRPGAHSSEAGRRARMTA